MKIYFIILILEHIHGTFLINKEIQKQKIINKCTASIMKDYRRNFFASNISFNLIFNCCDTQVEKLQKEIIIKYFEYFLAEFAIKSSFHLNDIIQKVKYAHSINIYKKNLYFILKNYILQNYPSSLVASEKALKDIFERSIPTVKLEKHIKDVLKENFEYINVKKETSPERKKTNLQNTQFKCSFSSFMENGCYFNILDLDFQLDRNIYIKNFYFDKKSEMYKIKDLIRQTSFLFCMDTSLIQAYSHIYFKCNFTFFRIRIYSVSSKNNYKEMLKPDLTQFKIFKKILSNVYERMVKDFFSENSKFNQGLMSISLNFFRGV
ncbi:hypothetical protein CWI38_0481p0020 [Hamiltosporidium tvaerminnensis]|uniref:Uncharacterized protein n=1 Tax=Hamiltosporidium tvaerminnensis TaxID=1176355 RepID=A0A4Q9L8U9_9MICR|nr:hypothetical protein LUQ84_001195 [Hamiltosporidium tvaerminnensis]TBU03816.1 hypothetical protein CWI37_0227p0010 [Hamiltosporidium tvaerminnensis]TBU11631.1 hypothetical protein CWI38_1108p0010 [Hamiltosporidium tvaerminnensis]TBU13276.1 hypothetical protein CWI38_0481p0020 [Hamiltosporidium tvaerminnensis]